MKAYKGFNKDMTCRGFQFKEGETYHEDNAKLCESGFHACTDPIDCFRYYVPSKSVYHEVEIDEISDEKSDDSKICGKTLKVGAALDVAGIVKAKFNIVKKICKNNKQALDNSALSAQDNSALSARNNSALSARNYSALSARNFSALSAQDFSALSALDNSALSAQDFSALSALDNSKLSAKDNSVLAAFNSKAKAGLNSLIALAKREWKGSEYVITDFAAAIVDGKTIKPDTWYTLKNGKFVEVEDESEE